MNSEGYAGSWKEEDRRVLIVDDERDFVDSLEDILESRGYRVEKAHSEKTACKTIKCFNAQVALLDIRLGRADGINLIAGLKKEQPGIICVMMTAYAAIETAVRAIQEGAYDYMQKPIAACDLLATLDRCFEKIQLEKEKKQLEARLHQAQRTETIAVLAGGIAHEFNNALFTISGNLQLLELDFPDNDQIQNRLTPMKAGISRMTGLTKQFITYAGKNDEQTEFISLSKLIKETLSQIEHTRDPSIRIDTDLPLDVSSVKGDSIQLRITLSALLTNACESIDKEGRMRVSVKNKKVEKDTIGSGYNLKPGLYVCVSIEDNGKGMDEETKKRIFEPFFSTKFPGRGLGLAVAYRIIKKYQGLILVDSSPETGTLVRVFLPAADNGM